MLKHLFAILCTFQLSGQAYAAPASSASLASHPTVSSSAPAPSPTVPFASDDPNDIAWNVNTNTTPEAIRGSLGATVLGPQNIALEKQNPDALAPPTTDSGSVSNAKWPFSLSHNRMQTGGWARQQNAQHMPIAQSMAGVNMRLEAGAIRELHWHQTAEWAYVLKGQTQITSVDQNGKNFVANVGPGDLWYFPPGIPHSLQATDETPDGSEFLLVFPDGNFSEDDTFLLTDWTAHIPKGVLAKNFQADISEFDQIPSRQLYIFPGVPPSSDEPVSNPQGQIPSPFSFNFANMSATQYSGGTAKIADSAVFPIAQIAVAEVTVEPGAMRELHWHPTQDEWTFYLAGTARLTLFASSSNAQTFNYEAGDVGFVPATFGHYVENIGNDTLHFLEISNTAHFQDVSLAQWMALTPPALVKAHLQLSDETIGKLNKTKQVVVAGRAKN